MFFGSIFFCGVAVNAPLFVFRVISELCVCVCVCAISMGIDSVMMSILQCVRIWMYMYDRTFQLKQA